MLDGKPSGTESHHIEAPKVHTEAPLTELLDGEIPF
jgi:hypothetical protein